MPKQHPEPDADDVGKEIERAERPANVCCRARYSNSADAGLSAGLAGTAGCLNVFSARLARVSDRVNSLFERVTSEDPDETRLLQLYYLRRRTLALEVAVLLGTASGMCTCLATLGLMGGAIRQQFREQLLLWFFGLAVIALMGAFVAFLFEMILAGRSMLKQIANDRTLLEHTHRSSSKSPTY